MRKDATDEKGMQEGGEMNLMPEMNRSIGSRTFAPAEGHRLSQNRLSKSLPEHLMAGMNAEHDVVMSMRLCEIRNHKYPKSQGLPPPAKFSKVQSAPARFARSCSMDELYTPVEHHGSCQQRRTVPDYDFAQVGPVFNILFFIILLLNSFDCSVQRTSKWPAFGYRLTASTPTTDQ
jgi:hypothetical protein